MARKKGFDIKTGEARIESKKSFCACETGDVKQKFPGRSKIDLKNCNCFVTPGLGKKLGPNPFDTDEFEIFFD